MYILKLKLHLIMSLAYRVSSLITWICALKCKQV